jgi:hypothetical protein
MNGAGAVTRRPALREQSSAIRCKKGDSLFRGIAFFMGRFRTSAAWPDQ